MVVFGSPACNIPPTHTSRSSPIRKTVERLGRDTVEAFNCVLCRGGVCWACRTSGHWCFLFPGTGPFGSYRCRRIQIRRARHVLFVPSHQVPQAKGRPLNTICLCSIQRSARSVVYASYFRLLHRFHHRPILNISPPRYVHHFAPLTAYNPSTWS